MVGNTRSPAKSIPTSGRFQETHIEAFPICCFRIKFLFLTFWHSDNFIYDFKIFRSYSSSSSLQLLWDTPPPRRRPHHVLSNFMPSYIPPSLMLLACTWVEAAIYWSMVNLPQTRPLKKLDSTTPGASMANSASTRVEHWLAWSWTVLILATIGSMNS